MNYKAGATLAVAALAVGLAGCADDSAQAEGLTRVTFAVADQSLSATSASYATVPDAMGYFKEEGLQVDMQPVETALSAIQSVASGNSFCTYGSTFNALQTVKDDPSLVVVGTTTGNIFRVIAPASLGITESKDLAGKTIGVSSLTSIATDVASIGMRKDGVEPGADQFLAVGYGAQTAQAFKNGDIQAYSGFDGPNLVVESLLGEDVVDVASDTDSLTGTSSLVCRKDDVKNKPEMVAGLWRAFFKAAVFSRENPKAAVQMHWEKFPASKPTSGDSEANIAMAASQLELRMETTGQTGSAGQYGQQEDSDMERLIMEGVDGGILDGAVADYPLDKVFDYSLVSQYNDFDEDAVIQQAKEWVQK
ncbi:ABC transporter substrate-binding protein [Arthrobacter ginkgonis]|uniref:ABC transporter substrate-binding protein n=1 Tax=Arthrobacter ginkgonis TaxID=1630594 RepID=A0ABP7C2G6_9MICC